MSRAYYLRVYEVQDTLRCESEIYTRYTCTKLGRGVDGDLRHTGIIRITRELSGIFFGE